MFSVEQPVGATGNRLDLVERRSARTGRRTAGDPPPIDDASGRGRKLRCGSKPGGGCSRDLGKHARLRPREALEAWPCSANEASGFLASALVPPAPWLPPMGYGAFVGKLLHVRCLASGTRSPAQGAAASAVGTYRPRVCDARRRRALQHLHNKPGSLPEEAPARRWHDAAKCRQQPHGSGLRHQPKRGGSHDGTRPFAQSTTPRRMATCNSSRTSSSPGVQETHPPSVARTRTSVQLGRSWTRRCHGPGGPASTSV
jgi:hypothetical protein